MPLNSIWKMNAVELTCAAAWIRAATAKHPAPRVVLDACQALQQLVVLDRVIVAPDAVPAGLSGHCPEISTCWSTSRWKR